jgi:hypothetical protein
LAKKFRIHHGNVYQSYRRKAWTADTSPSMPTTRTQHHTAYNANSQHPIPKARLAPPLAKMAKRWDIGLQSRVRPKEEDLGRTSPTPETHGPTYNALINA